MDLNILASCIPAYDISLLDVESVIAESPELRLEGLDQNVALVITFAPNELELNVGPCPTLGLVEAVGVGLVVVTVVLPVAELGLDETLAVGALPN